jgi:hypothetical protein
MLRVSEKIRWHGEQMNDKQKKIIDRVQMDRNLLFKEKAQCILGNEERSESPKTQRQPLNQSRSTSN